jgi:2-aminoethylphosphonate-pyruvate transaminase
MPYADSALTARQWATQRALALWVLFAGDIPASDLRLLAPAFQAIRVDRGRLALIETVDPGSIVERDLADFVVRAAPAPAPFGIFNALQAAGLEDVRNAGVLGASAEVLVAGQRAGAGAVIGLAADGAARRLLLPAQPDALVAPASFGALDADRFASGRAHRQRVLLNPGPAVVGDRVHRAVAGPDLCHREPEYAAIYTSIRRKLLRLAEVGEDWGLALLAGSGTSAMEAMVLGAVRPGRKLLVCRNGIYGQRLETIARRHGLEVVLVDASELEPIDPRTVADALAADAAIDAVAVVHHETTTGLLNPVREIAAAAKARGVLVLVDAISSFGAEDLTVSGSGIDFLACTSNKCLHGLPGVAFVLLSPLAQARVAVVPPRSLYLDMGAYLQAQARGSVPFTPAIPAVYGLDAALDELFDQGPAERRACYQARMEYLDREFSRLGLELRVALAHRSRCVRSLPLPQGVTYEALHDALKAEGYIIYGGLGEAARTSFRACALGALTIDALAGFIAALERALAAKRATTMA